MWLLGPRVHRVRPWAPTGPLHQYPAQHRVPPAHLCPHAFSRLSSSKYSWKFPENSLANTTLSPIHRGGSEASSLSMHL